ncbi:MAG: RNA-binding cell elongation regulator Jag/EloR [Actinomycetes bacterium]
MEWVETTGRTVDEAVDAALTVLGVDESDLEYEVIQEPKSGLLGRFGGSPARIRARVKPISREKPNDRRRRRKGERGEGGDRTGPRSGQRGGGRQEGKGGGRQKPKAAEAPEVEGAVATASTDEGEARAEGSGGTRGRNRRRGGSGRSSGGSGEHVVEKSSVPVAEQARVAEEFLVGLVEAFGYQGTATSEIEEDDITVSIEGEGLGLLIGPQGATMQAIEELSRAVLHRHCGTGTARLHVDVSGYRAARRQALADFAAKVARHAIDSGKEQALDPMNSADRKVIHDALIEVDGISTLSEGEDPRRYVVIRPS